MKAYFLIAFFTAVVACQSGAEAPAAEATAEKPQMYEYSELAALMEKMYQDNAALKKEIEAGKVPQSFPEDFLRMHDAEATDPNDKNDTYHALAKVYLSQMDSIVQSPDAAHAKRAFNNMVTTCVNCHQVFCQGPIPRIQKLRIQ
jgi:cytochrome c553